MSCSSSEELGGHSNCYCQGHESHPGSSCKCGTPVELAPGTLEELDEIQGIQQTKMSVEEERSAPPATRLIWPRWVV